MTKKQRTITCNISSQFRLSKVIGEGAYGTVCSGIHVASGRKVAIKKINAFTNPLMCLRTLREVMLLKKFCGHENIVSLYHVEVPPSIDQFNEVYLVQEFMPTDLHRVISGRVLTDDHIQYFTYQILRGLKAMHSAGVIHRDLKPSNVLIDDNCDLKICDLGLSRLHRQDGGDGSISSMTEYVATRWYRAPEIMLSPSHYSKAVDLWSVGCILGEMLIGKALFPGKDYRDQLLQILRLLGNPSKHSEDMKLLTSKRAKQYLESLPNYERLDFNSVFQHHPLRSFSGGSSINPWAIDLLERLLIFDPAKRLTVEEAICHPYVAMYHDYEDEPVCSPISAMEFDFDMERRSRLDLHELKVRLYDVIRVC
ncbi:mitogen activated protein kinase [Yamadazyma tenuis]|uniref:Mitogen-activated protein kinase n=1 Tax=Candida tenuis (strain ATCC 10573 / BCRC 21748 / CBS 615 / JCM 9827 / NBRC 10315 / NRRL Y-1498 / VKM Y-70) TaxID=590646 RepID=G3B072_CANTC|nr:uncharacterized protein CANTEDRAFT_102580 [Yamadazyma tenuis ATCC 10573]EGV65334.1 hypothetical protein CANTEDRAFT_102580 [Yamadazyma tenuis ATCC 10573]WEJ95009.1 mitogen activated protein kinase [Yamadazyma tenuis]